MKSDQLWSVTDIELLPFTPRVADRQHTVDSRRSPPRIPYRSCDGAPDPVGPGAFQLPNLIVAGAVDITGHGTALTSYVKNVAVHGDKYEVDGRPRSPISRPSCWRSIRRSRRHN